MGYIECTSLTIFRPPGVKGAPQSSEDEAFLIHQILKGRDDRFVDLVEPHMTVLSRVVRNKMRNDSEAEDVIQETLLKAFARLQQFRFKASFRTWLIQIAINEVLQWHRTRAHAQFPMLNESVLLDVQVADEFASPLKQCERRETLGWFRRALAKLPENYQIVIRLRDLEHLSIAETAQVLHLSAAAVKTRHRRARLRFTRFLTGTQVKFESRQ
jgi:RNA polymerase sigma-70 factor (ECF subfamily)